MRKNKLLLLLALLLTAATGAWADETPLLTIESTDYTSFRSGSMTFDDKVTVTFSNPVTNTGNTRGWYANPTASLLTVAGTNGYTITSCKFYAETGAAATGYTVAGESPSVYLYSKKVFTDANQSVEIGQRGIMKIEVFGAAASAGYTVSLKDGVKDADKWTVKVGDGQAQALPIGGLKGNGSETVTLKYTGRLKVKGVKATSDAAPAAPAGKTVDLSTLTADYEAKDGETLTGNLASNVKISIADGATVKLKDATINGGDDYSYKWAGLNCAGDATITLEGTNMVKGFYNEYPGIYVPSGKTLTIQGTGSLNATSNGYAAGIGGGYQIACGNIVINSGTVEATGGDLAAGIGGGNRASCGNITINGGTVEATGGSNAAGIGGGSKNGACGTITITSGVTSVTATKGANAPYSIGKGNGGQDITVNIGGVEGAITTSPYTYEAGSGGDIPNSDPYTPGGDPFSF